MSRVRHYPLFLSLQGRRCLVVGAGPVAARKVRGLLAAGARVTLVAPFIPSSLARRKDVVARRRPFRDADVMRGKPPALVFAATDDRAVNARVAALCRRRGIWAGAADRPAEGTFIVPSTVRRGNLILAFSTGGASPAAAKLLRERAERLLDPLFDRAVRALERMRPRLRKVPLARRRRILSQALRPSSMASLRRLGAAGWARRLRAAIEREASHARP